MRICPVSGFSYRNGTLHAEELPLDEPYHDGYGLTLSNVQYVFLNEEDAEEFLAGAPAALILGDNIFYGTDLAGKLLAAAQRSTGATVFAYHVTDPERYGVVEFDDARRAVSVEEKPVHPRSHYAITGLYFYDNAVCDIAADIAPSARGELEITDVHRAYLERGALQVEVLGRGTAWLDAGTHDSLLDAGQFIATIQKRQGLKISCPEEIAYRKGYIDLAQLQRLAAPLARSGYGEYLLKLSDDGHD